MSRQDIDDNGELEALDDLYEMPESLATQTVIQNRYCFWYKQKHTKTTTEDYESSIKQLASFQTVEHFWRIYNHMHRAHEVPSGDHRQCH